MHNQRIYGVFQWFRIDRRPWHSRQSVGLRRWNDRERHERDVQRARAHRDGVDLEPGIQEVHELAQRHNVLQRLRPDTRTRLLDTCQCERDDVICSIAGGDATENLFKALSSDSVWKLSARPVDQNEKRRLSLASEETSMLKVPRALSESRHAESYLRAQSYSSHGGRWLEKSK